MAVEVIKRGVKPEERTAEATCSVCGTIFKMQRKDCREHMDQRDGNYYTIPCPLCSVNISLCGTRFK